MVGTEYAEHGVVRDDIIVNVVVYVVVVYRFHLMHR